MTQNEIIQPVMVGVDTFGQIVHCTIKYITVHCNALQYITVQYRTLLYIVQYITLQYILIHNNPVESATTANMAGTCQPFGSQFVQPGKI